MDQKMNTTKKEYVSPKIEKLVFDPENIIITSGSFPVNANTHEAVSASCSSTWGDNTHSQSHSLKIC